ncbi:SRPBCC family protein [Tuwongella immobilis]|uniref:Activator of Hsp90 ATPase homologue 1/2-like C-terminal domain-containing protein n=1 Tax=Tuwongella immobilis TaxID=692036 RepID=A0A6C2YKL7_9BACT|nr:SRPBCC family protein [Tuwongella immobilis]VIP02118.1 atpase : Uncharacterized protein OS=Singulisphaera acidiphila (strain ATCC BAA-1392 / DSM 18658 / VKM B-2454 / MOB10) GN=Sinac_1871 PE=4 SV=1: AHSA1 [Tuwongella immobilis]VTS00440.1 atpase : Uncharacterized protein OS=Singulisphaera acidiphila (strain ATCC BAA-1392 / DSM 18658 / VKM B-2454 / MOB10) GN=Sinac_1871 PE=4 SV=1: AHSA1 [Tuwongella immobilis]
MSMNPPVSIQLPSDCEIVLTRQFRAPRDLVFRAMIEPTLVRRWLSGPPGWTMTDCEIDAQVGGRYRYRWASDDGQSMQMTGEYREVVAPERLVNTETFDFGCASQAGEQVGTAVLTEANGVTTLTTTVVYPNKVARDGTLAAGMEHGVANCYRLLDAILDEVSAAA